MPSNSDTRAKQIARFCYHFYDSRPNWTPLSLTQSYYHYKSTSKSFTYLRENKATQKRFPCSVAAMTVAAIGATRFYSVRRFATIGEIWQELILRSFLQLVVFQQNWNTSFIKKRNQWNHEKILRLISWHSSKKKSYLKERILSFHVIDSYRKWKLRAHKPLIFCHLVKQWSDQLEEEKRCHGSQEHASSEKNECIEQISSIN